MKKHYKKLVQPYFDLKRLGIKTFELRKNDCDYQEGDIVVWQEFDEINRLLNGHVIPNGYTGREITSQIRFILKDYKGLQEGYVIIADEVLECNG